MEMVVVGGSGGDTSYFENILEQQPTLIYVKINGDTSNFENILD